MDRAVGTEGPPAALGGGWIENRPTQSWRPRVDLRELWHFRELALTLALRDLKLRYKQAAFGAAWALIQPLTAALIFSVVFGHLADLPSDGIAYPVFVYAGLAVWLYFAGAIDAAAQSLVEHRDLVTKTYFPRMLAPLAAILPGLLDLALALGVLVVFMVVYEVAPTAALLTLPAWIVAMVALAFAAGLWLAALNALYRDVRYTIAFLIQVWLFASPVVYSSSLLDGAGRVLYAVNPIVGLLDGFRWSLVGGPAPPAADMLSALTGALLLTGGALYFQHVERRIADRI